MTVNSPPVVLGEAIDLSHHLSNLAKKRIPSPLKGLQKYFGKPGMLSVAGGLPHPSYFPFEKLKADALVSDSFSINTNGPQSKGALSWIWDLLSKDSTMPISIPKYPQNPEDVNLAVALQYGLAKGLPQLQKIVHDFSETVYRPAYTNFATTLHDGNTDGWNKCLMTLCNPGEGVLTSEWTYPSAIASMRPFDISPVPVAMDGQGMSSSALREILSTWDANARNMPRPHVMYIVPVGQNPTGTTMEAQRKKEIYAICVEYDIIIVEDDPYYFLQEGPYVNPPERRSSGSHASIPSDEEYINSLAPSFIRFDYQGRVVRLDTFSKTIAPGSRLGWFTCNPIFAEKFDRQSETSTQQPCGFGQSLITELLLNWKSAGYLRWLKGLRGEYTRRRDFFVDCIVENFHVEVCPESKMHGAVHTYRYLVSDRNITSGYNPEKVAEQKVLFSFIPPTAGMFVWIKLDFGDHPKIEKVGQEGLEMKLWTELAEAGLLVGPGSMFSADGKVASFDAPGHFRMSFSNAEFQDLKKAVDIFAAVIKNFYEHN